MRLGERAVLAETVIQKVREQRPHDYLKIVATVLPKRMEIEEQRIQRRAEDPSPPNGSFLLILTLLILTLLDPLLTLLDPQWGLGMKSGVGQQIRPLDP